MAKGSKQVITAQFSVLASADVLNGIIVLVQVFLEYADTDGATKARAGLNGRKFGGNVVTAVFYPENKFAQGDYEG